VATVWLIWKLSMWTSNKENSGGMCARTRAHAHTHTHIYIYIERERERESKCRTIICSHCNGLPERMSSSTRMKKKHILTIDSLRHVEV
jgi:hypothetical protein